MKYLVLTALLLPAFVFAQNGKRDALNPNQLDVKELILGTKKTAPPEIKLPFKSIRIIDSRYDSSKIGYVPDVDFISSYKKIFKKMTLKDGVSSAIENYYNKYYAGSFTQNGFELLIVIKRLWISGNARSNNKEIESTTDVKSNDNIYCKWEYYIGKDGKYLPVKRVDSIIRGGEDFLKYEEIKLIGAYEAAIKKIVSFFRTSLQRLIEFLDYSNAIKQFDIQTKKTLPEIYEFNKRMNVMPVLQDSIIKKGVYLSFEEFKNNRPSIADFREKKMHYGTGKTENYLENMKGESISNYWGYSDGKEFRYGMLGNDKVYRIQNTFCFFIKIDGVTVGSIMKDQYGERSLNSSTKSVVWVPYQVDMETGEVY